KPCSRNVPVKLATNGHASADSIGRPSAHRTNPSTSLESLGSTDAGAPTLPLIWPGVKWRSIEQCASGQAFPSACSRVESRLDERRTIALDQRHRADTAPGIHSSTSPPLVFRP